MNHGQLLGLLLVYEVDQPLTPLTAVVMSVHPVEFAGILENPSDVMIMICCTRRRSGEHEGDEEDEEKTGDVSLHDVFKKISK